MDKPFDEMTEAELRELYDIPDDVEVKVIGEGDLNPGIFDVIGPQVAAQISHTLDSHLIQFLDRTLDLAIRSRSLVFQNKLVSSIFDLLAYRAGNFIGVCEIGGATAAEDEAIFAAFRETFNNARADAHKRAAELNTERAIGKPQGNA